MKIKAYVLKWKIPLAIGLAVLVAASVFLAVFLPGSKPDLASLSREQLHKQIQKQPNWHVARGQLVLRCLEENDYAEATDHINYLAEHNYDIRQLQDALDAWFSNTPNRQAQLLAHLMELSSPWALETVVQLVKHQSYFSYLLTAQELLSQDTGELTSRLLSWHLENKQLQGAFLMFLLNQEGNWTVEAVLMFSRTSPDHFCHQLTAISRMFPLEPQHPEILACFEAAMLGNLGHAWQIALILGEARQLEVRDSILLRERTIRDNLIATIYAISPENPVAREMEALLDKTKTFAQLLANPPAELSATDVRNFIPDDIIQEIHSRMWNLTFAQARVSLEVLILLEQLGKIDSSPEWMKLHLLSSMHCIDDIFNPVPYLNAIAPDELFSWLSGHHDYDEDEYDQEFYLIVSYNLSQRPGWSFSRYIFGESPPPPPPYLWGIEWEGWLENYRVSPDGKHMVYLQWNDEEEELRDNLRLILTSQNGADHFEILFLAHSDSYLSDLVFWSPDSAWLAIAASEQVYIYRTSASGPSLAATLSLPGQTVLGWQNTTTLVTTAQQGSAYTIRLLDALSGAVTETINLQHQPLLSTHGKLAWLVRTADSLEVRFLDGSLHTAPRGDLYFHGWLAGDKGLLLKDSEDDYTVTAEKYIFEFSTSRLTAISQDIPAPFFTWGQSWRDEGTILIGIHVGEEWTVNHVLKLDIRTMNLTHTGLVGWLDGFQGEHIYARVNSGRVWIYWID